MTILRESYKLLQNCHHPLFHDLQVIGNGNQLLQEKAVEDVLRNNKCDTVTLLASCK